MSLTVKRRKFIDFYLESGNATEAAKRAGYSDKTAYAIGSELLRSPHIVAIIEERLGRLSVSDETIARVVGRGRQNKQSDWVYMVQEDFAGLVKIGIATNPISRLTTLQIACPQNLTLVAALKTPDALEAEAELHARFSSKYARGEWFRLTEDDIQDIRQEWLDCQISSERSLMNTSERSTQLTLI